MVLPFAPGKVVLITGGALGIGRAVAELLAQTGCRLVLADRDGAGARRATEGLAIGPRALGLGVDVLDWEQVQGMIRQAIETFGRLDALVNTVGGSSGHGIRGARTIEELELADWDRTFDLNVKSVFYCCRAAIPALRAAGGGRIVNTASVAGRSQSQLGGPQYAAAKAAVIGFTRQLAFQLARDNITVNAIAPGPTRSERVAAIWDQRPEEQRQEILARIPMARLGEPNEMAAAIAFLLSDAAGYITGQTIDVNGGLFMS
jgi:NAD(P)-dependent dehydrogenase (short-subunit alcohol dehydrogenase family)